jgi:lysophospholipase L1-like esterase
MPCVHRFARGFPAGLVAALAMLVAATAVAAEAVEAVDAVDAGHDTPAIQQSGRAEHGTDTWRVTWPAVAWRAAFSGTSVAVVTQDTAGYQVEIDRREMAPIQPSQAEQTSWYRGLGSGAHLIEIVRKNVTPGHAGLFLGFRLDAPDGRWLKPPAPPLRQIEFISDSQSTGYGDLSSGGDCADDQVAALSDASQSFPVLTARRLHADWQLNAMNGIGVVRNWHGIWKDSNYASYYPRTLLNDPASRYHSVDWRPQVVVIGLGANDFSTPLAADEAWTPAQLQSEFRRSYRSLIADVRRRYGRRALIVALRPSLDENQANQEVARIVQQLRSQGDRQLYFLQFPPLQRTGCMTHPNIADHRLMSTVLAQFIEQHARLPSASLPGDRHRFDQQ